MLNRPITNRIIMRNVGWILFLIALFFSLRIALEPIQEVYTTRTDVRPLIEISFVNTFFKMAHQGTPLLGAAGIVLLGLSSGRISIAYWSLQLAIWLAGASFWYGTAFVLNPFPENPVWAIITMISSFILLLLYRPLSSLLKKLMMPRNERFAN